MAKLRDKLFVWGQDPGTHHEVGWNLPGINGMTPAEGCKYFGIKNCARVVMCNKPEPPYDGDMEKLADIDQVMWSITGDEYSHRTTTPYGELDEVLRLAEKYPKIVGGILDDFWNDYRMNLGIYTPELVAEIHQKLHNAKNKPLDLYGVIYDWIVSSEERNPRLIPYLEHLDVATLWTWYGENLKDLEKNLSWLEEHAPGKRFGVGLYMWDYGNSKPYTREQVEYQLCVFQKWLLEKRIDIVFVCSNCTMDVGIEAVDWTRDWVARVGDLEIPD